MTSHTLQFDFTAEAPAPAVDKLGGWEYVAWYECPRHGLFPVGWAVHPLDYLAFANGVYRDDLPDGYEATFPACLVEACPDRWHDGPHGGSLSTSEEYEPMTGRMLSPTRFVHWNDATDEDRERAEAFWARYRPPEVAPPTWRKSAQAVMDDDKPDPKCLPVFGRDGIVVEGWAHLLAAKAKGGKTTLLSRVVRDWLDAGLRICWLTEEAESVWRMRLRRLGGNWDGVTLVFPGDRSQSEVMADAMSDTYDVTIVDTVRAFVPSVDENDAATMAKALRPWVNAAHEAGRTLILVVHERKGGGQHGEGIAGSHEILAAVDQAIEVTYASAEDSRRRKLTTLGREFEPVSLLYEMDVDGGLYEIGDTRTVQAKEFNRDVLAVMPPGQAMSTQEVAAELDPRPNRQRLARVLTRLCETGRVQRTPPFPEVVNGSTVRWTHRAGTD